MSEDNKNIEQQQQQQPIEDKHQTSEKETDDQNQSSTVSSSKEKNVDQQKETLKNVNESSIQKNANQDNKEKNESQNETTKLPDVIYIQRNYNKYPNSDHSQARTPPIYFDESFPSILERRVNKTKSNSNENKIFLLIIQVILYLGCQKS
jgi:hypothetical protein